jgi:hypothetical protein
MRNMYWKCLVLDFHKVMAALILVVLVLVLLDLTQYLPESVMVQCFLQSHGYVY